jgi:NitT/TauT family transport system permease protein
MTAARSLRVPTSWVRGAIGAAVLFVLLELLTRAELVTPTYLPPASEIVVETVKLFGESAFWSALAETMKATLYGLLRATVIAVPLGVLTGLSRWFRVSAMTVVELLRPLPSVALIPLAIIVYGRGTEMKVFLVTFACLWPILFNTVYGMFAVDQVAIDTARTFGLGRFKTAWRVQLRAASPFIFTGIRIASAVALILAISAEIIGGGANGLGIELALARANSDLKLSYAYTIITGLIGLTFHLVFEIVERRLFAWNIDAREA